MAISMNPIIKSVGEDTSNKNTPSQSEIGTGVVFSSLITSSEVNGFEYIAFEAIKYMQRTGGLYGATIPYVFPQIARLVTVVGGVYSVDNFIRTTGNAGNTTGYPPITGATVTTTEGVAVYTGGTIDSTRWQKCLDTGLTKLIAENNQVITGAGFTLDANDNMQMEKAIAARRNPVGSFVESEIELTPVIYSAARSTVNPSYPEYNPIIKRYDADHDVTSTMAPDLVTLYRAEKATLNINGLKTTDFPCTVSGSVLTFPATAASIAFVMMFNNEAAANGYAATQSATYTNLYTGTAQRCVNINGTDYPVSTISVASRTITVTGTPASGAQTAIAYTHRIAGSTTSIRLPRLSGLVGVVTQDYDGEIIAGWRKMDRGQGHWHNVNRLTGSGSNYQVDSNVGTGSTTYDLLVGLANTIVTNNTDGTPRTGKTTDPRSIGKYVYTHAGRLLAAVV